MYIYIYIYLIWGHLIEVDTPYMVYFRPYPNYTLHGATSGSVQRTTMNARLFSLPTYPTGPSTLKTEGPKGTCHKTHARTQRVQHSVLSLHSPQLTTIMGRPLAVLAASALAATTGMGPSSSSFPSVAVAFPVETSQVTSFRHYTRSSRLHDTITPVSAATESNPSMSCYPSGHLNARRHSTTSSSMMTITSRSSPARPTGSSGFLASKMTRAAPGSVWIGGRTGIAKAEALTRTGDGRATGAGRWSMTSYDNYARDYLGPRLWPKPPLKPLSGESWNRCDEMVELGSSGLMVSKVKRVPPTIMNHARSQHVPRR